MEAPAGTFSAPDKGKDVLATVYAPTVMPESTPLTKTFMLERGVTVEPALLGAAVKVIDVAFEATLTKEDATGDVLTRNTDSLFNVTLVVPNVFGEAVVLGL